MLFPGNDPGGYSGWLVITLPNRTWVASRGDCFLRAAMVRVRLGGACRKMNQAQAVVIIAAELRLFLRPGRRSAPVAVVLDGTSLLGHVVESLGGTA